MKKNSNLNKNLILRFCLCFCVCFCANFNQKISAQKLCIAKRIIKNPNEVKAKGMGVNGTFWKSGQTITIKFIQGSPFLRKKIKEISAEWLKYANLKFEFVADTSSFAMVSISFIPGSSSSATGKISASVQPEGIGTMNFGWFDNTTSNYEFSRVILHEFGHMLGLDHEQNHPESTIRWNKEKIYEDYAKEGCDKQYVDTNIIYTAKRETRQYNSYDRLSIMHYGIPAAHTLDNIEITGNSTLSEIDKAFIRQIYSGNNSSDNVVTDILPRNLTTDWVGIPFPKIDATITYGVETYLFYGNKCLRWGNNGYSDMIPFPLSKWNIPFKQIDEAFFSSVDGKVYFFSGDEYIKYDMALRKTLVGYPQKITDNWKELKGLGKIDGVIPWGSDIFFFSGNQYVRCDFYNYQIYEGYPKMIKDNWKGVDFDKVETTLMHDYPNVYIFKGNQYYRFDMDKNETF